VGNASNTSRSSEAWPIERLEELRQQYVNSGNSRAAAVAYINGLHYELQLRLTGPETASINAAELQRLRDIEHYAWHLMDGSEEDATTGEVTIRPMREDYDTLSKLLPEAHP
jgi:hypothetical protein